MYSFLMSIDRELEHHTLALVRDFLRSRGYTGAQMALDAAVPPEKGEPQTREEMVHNLTLTRLLKARKDPLPDSTLELVVDTMLRRSRMMRKYEQQVVDVSNGATDEIKEAEVGIGPGATGAIKEAEVGIGPGATDAIKEAEVDIGPPPAALAASEAVVPATEGAAATEAAAAAAATAATAAAATAAAATVAAAGRGDSGCSEAATRTKGKAAADRRAADAALPSAPSTPMLASASLAVRPLPSPPPSASPLPLFVLAEVAFSPILSAFAPKASPKKALSWPMGGGT